ncbi:hypothetical protein V6N11_034406 [Hibiscus sabdariffa]|uniref:Uncharacterized protein n=1 Tax=Hibiscus sabdariffa TaxID=183260 RepID=A0ABR1Z8L8_9ROSI
MGEKTSNTMNLDLNLGPTPESRSGSMSDEVVNADNLVDNPFGKIREAVRQRGNFGSVNTTMQVGEDSVAAEKRTSDVSKACESTNEFFQDVILEDRK